ncbi:deferrochelatase/peroxidase EfeB, partial [Streptomyces sp. SID7982]|nr:deferrochelatase/peroxidase EfeB [Streptomyces sp. SID7982]
MAGGAVLIGTVSAGAASGVSTAAPDEGRVPFHGAHQAGILTPQQRFGGFVAFDVLARDRKELAALF